MAIKFNQQLHNDILKLSSLRKKISKSDFKKLFAELSARHKLSRASVYRELRKVKPGSYSDPAKKLWMGKITKSELDHLAELLVARKSNEELLTEMSRYKKFLYSPQRLAKAKQKLSHFADMINNPKPKIVHHLYDPKLIDGLKISKVSYISSEGRVGAKPKNPKLPAYEGNASKLFYELASLDIKDPEEIQKLVFGGTSHYVKNSVIKACLDHIAASSETGGRSIEDSLNFSLFTLLRQQLNSASRRGYITPLELKHLASIKKEVVQNRKPPCGSGGKYTFDEVMHIVGVFSPSASREKVAAIIAGHPFLNPSRQGQTPPGLNEGEQQKKPPKSST